MSDNKNINPVKLARMKRRILELEKENLLTNAHSEREMKELIERIILEEERKTY